MKEKEFQQRIKPINYPNRLLELGGLIELFDFEESSESSSSCSTNNRIRKNLSTQWIISRNETEYDQYGFKLSDGNLAESERLSLESQIIREYIDHPKFTFDIDNFSIDMIPL